MALLLVVLRNTLSRTRSKDRIVHVAIELERWLEHVPRVEDVRPKRCPACKSVGAPMGRRLVIVGHGKRDRTVVGPMDHEDSPGRFVTIRVRRFRCRACTAVFVVVPLGIVRGRRFSAYAIARALALFGLLGMSVTAVRDRLSRWRCGPDTTNLAWEALKRWARAVRERRLFKGLPRAPPGVSLRRVAERAAMALIGASHPAHSVLGVDVQAGYGGMVIALEGMA